MNTKSQLERLAEGDPFVQWLGASLDRAEPGEVSLTMPIREDHISFNGTCHGGVLFSLADTAFGLASNSHGIVAVGIHTDMAFCAPVKVGDTVVAEAAEISRSKRVGTYRVLLSKQDGTTVAVFTGTVHRTERHHEKS
ncbi:MAG: hotdog fold thioesterase [Arenicellales bacterium]|nr:hotdog fold thioesterase [Arenicellales bacterium]